MFPKAKIVRFQANLVKRNDPPLYPMHEQEK